MLYLHEKRNDICWANFLCNISWGENEKKYIEKLQILEALPYYTQNG